MTASELKTIVDLLTAKPPPVDPSVAYMRARFEKLATLFPPPETMVNEPTDAGGIPAEWVSASGARADAAILYLHGGGYCIGSIGTHRVMCHGLAEAAQARVLVTDYRLAPEHPFPAAVEDAVSAYRWLLAEGFDPARIALAGDSAGGGLVIAGLVAFRDAGVPLPACAVSISPWVDLELASESMATLSEADPMVNRPDLERLAAHYLAGQSPKTPLAAPLHADLAGLPPLLIQVGAPEALRDDATRLAERADAAGVATTLEVWDDMIHVWHLFAPILSEGREALAKAGAFVRGHLDGDE